MASLPRAMGKTTALEPELQDAVSLCAPKIPRLWQDRAAESPLPQPSSRISPESSSNRSPFQGGAQDVWYSREQIHSPPQRVAGRQALFSPGASGCGACGCVSLSHSSTTAGGAFLPMALLSSQFNSSSSASTSSSSSAPCGDRVDVVGPDWWLVGYKVVARAGDGFCSIWAGESAQYQLGVQVKDTAMHRRAGGIYVCATEKDASRQHLPRGPQGMLKAGPRCVLRCACLGPFVEYDSGKVACSQLLPLAELPLGAVAVGPASSGPPGDAHRRLAKRTVEQRLVPRDALGRLSTMLYWDVVGYKVVAKVGDSYFSLWAGKHFPYILGTTLHSCAQPELHGGLYVCRTVEDAVVGEVPASPEFFAAHRAVLRCACNGPFVLYPDGAMSCSRLTPLEEVLLLLPPSSPATSPVARGGPMSLEDKARFAVQVCPAGALAPAAASLTSQRPREGAARIAPAKPITTPPKRLRPASAGSGGKRGAGVPVGMCPSQTAWAARVNPWI